MPSTVNYTHIIFDLDGTLVDSREHILRYNRDLFNFFKRPFPEDEEELFYTLDKDALERRFFKPEDANQLATFRKQNPYINRLNEITPLQGATHLLTKLHHLEVHLAIVTNRGTSTKRLLTQLGWLHFFDFIVSADMLSNPKPHPQGLIQCLSGWQQHPKDTLFIGDSAIDAEAADLAGCPFVQVTAVSPPLPQKRHFSQLEQLLVWLLQSKTT
ncbi:pyrophosphatase PpaX-like [Ylistrum balloti]|uniref:pyrophosphatase PpaX-like n=1 Tax=Ylistrum balloti TaxID=509963 RepID=UPI002905A499|nr:pyrophosphatase PpaX-like [Ylistrum balloti]